MLILNARSAVSEAVLNEVEMAHNFAKNGDCAVVQPVCTETFDFDAPDFQEMMYYIRRRHFVDVTDCTGMEQWAERIILSQPALLAAPKQRSDSAYVVQAKEDDRLLRERDLKKFDIINISMLLHLKNPLRLLTRLHHYLAQEGTVIIRDIDDGIQFDQFQFVQIWCFCVW